MTSNQNNWEWNINATEQEYQIRLDENKTRKTFEIYINDEKVYEQKRIRMIWFGLDYSFQIENKQCRVVFDVMNWEMDLLIDNQDFKTGKKYASKIKGFLELCIIMIILFVGLLLIHIGMWWIYIPFVVVAIGGVHWGLKHIDIK